MEILRDTHHCFWIRRSYHHRPFNLLRELVVCRNVLIQPHNNLHATMSPPPKPPTELAWNIVDYLDGRGSFELDSVFYTIDYLAKLATDEARTLTEHLTQQVGFFI